MNFRFIVSALALTMCLLSCKDPNELGSNYYYLPQYESIDVGYPYGSILYKSSVKNSFGDVIVYNNVKQIAVNQEFILVCQVPDKEMMRKYLIEKDSFWRHSNSTKIIKDTLVAFPHGKESLKKIKENKNISSEAVADSLLSNETYYRKQFANNVNYWIINKHDDVLLGPLTKQEYLIKLKELKVPDDLQLDK